MVPPVPSPSESSVTTEFLLLSKFRPEMMTLVSAVTRSTLTDTVRPDGNNLRLYVFGFQPAFARVALAEFKSLAPFGAAQAGLHRIPDEFLGGDLFLPRRFLDLIQKLIGQPYVSRCHTSILRLFGKISRL